MSEMTRGTQTMATTAPGLEARRVEDRAGAAIDAWASPEAPATNGAGTMLGDGGRTDPRSFVGPEATPPRGVRQHPHPVVPSAAAIAGHPLHPTFVPLPIGAFALALGSDVAYAATRDPFFARASRLLLGAGIASGAAAGLLGAIDFTSRKQTREHGEAWAHAGGNIAAMALSGVNLALRSRGGSVLPAGLAMSVVTGLLLLVTGWLGGELSYRHRIGVAES
jgi:uncharacterized membrane protein